MSVAGRTVNLLLSEDGRDVLRLASINPPDDPLFTAKIVESEELGLWMQIFRDGVEHHFLLRWEYILGIDVPAVAGKIVGLTGRKDLE